MLNPNKRSANQLHAFAYHPHLDLQGMGLAVAFSLALKSLILCT